MADEEKSEKKSGNELFEKYFGEIKRFWEKLPKRIRILMIAVIILSVAAFAALSVVDRTEDAVLFSNLAPEDASAIIEYLKGKHVTYKIERNGTSITVPKDQVHELRLELAGEGIPVGGAVGFELFDEQKFGMTEFEERLALRRALEGELSRTITKLDSVKSARAHLVLPKRSVLGAQSTPAQASIILELQRGRELSEGTIRSVIHLVSSSVEGLSPDRVTVVDTRGRLLSSEAGSGADDKEYGYQRKFEQDMELRLREMLHQILGPDASIVRVSALFDFSKMESTEEHYDPDRSVLRSEQRETETVGSQSGTAGGTPGMRTNLPGGEAPVIGSAGQNKHREEETRNYEVDRVVKKTVGPNAHLSRISVAVLVNGKNKPAEPFTPRETADLNKIETAVRGAVGYDATRGDSVNVQSVPFHNPEDMEPLDATKPMWWKEWVPLAVGGLVAIVLIIAVLSLRRKKKVGKRVPLDQLQLPRPIQELEAIIEKPEAFAEMQMASKTEVPQIPEQSPVAALMGEVRQVFMDESEAASKVIKTWLADAKRQSRERQKQNAQQEEVT